MKKILTFVVLTLLLTGLVFASPITSHATENSEEAQGEQLEAQAETANSGEATQIQARVLTQAEVQEIKQEQKRIRIQAGECPEECDCTGSTMKCALENNGREMTVSAGNSGNVIIQVQGAQASTTATLYQSEGKVYREYNGEVTEVAVMLDSVKERVRNRVNQDLTEEEMILQEDGTYKYQAKKQVKVLGMFRARATVRAEINSETGEVERVRNAWWTFLASDVEETAE